MGIRTHLAETNEILFLPLSTDIQKVYPRTKKISKTKNLCENSKKHVLINEKKKYSI